MGKNVSRRKMLWNRNWRTYDIFFIQSLNCSCYCTWHEIKMYLFVRSRNCLVTKYSRQYFIWHHDSFTREAYILVFRSNLLSLWLGRYLCRKLGMIFWYVKVSCYLDCRWGKWPPRKQGRNPNSQLSCNILIRSNSTHRTWRSWSTHSQESCEWVDNIGEDIAEGWLLRFWPCSWVGHLNLPISISKLHTYDDRIINGL